MSFLGDIFGAITSPVASVASSLIGGALGAVGQSNTNQANASSALAQQQFQSQMTDADRAFAQDQASQARAYNSMMVGQANQFQVENRNQEEAYNSAEASISRDFNAQQAAQQMQFQQSMFNQATGYDTAMSNTAYQRGVADMKAAGINPILAAGQGAASSPTISIPSGDAASSPTPSAPDVSPTVGSTSMMGSSSVPQGARATFQNPMKSIQEGLGGAVSSAMQVAKIQGDLASIAANITNTNADTLAKGAQKSMYDAQANMYGATAAKTAADTGNVPYQQQVLQSEVDRNAAMSAQARAAAVLSNAQTIAAKQNVNFNADYGRPGVFSGISEGFSQLLGHLTGHGSDPPFPSTGTPRVTVGSPVPMSFGRGAGP